MGIGLRFGLGPLRVFIPLTPRRRRRRSRGRYWTHPGCTIRHQSEATTNRCRNRPAAPVVTASGSARADLEEARARRAASEARHAQLDRFRAESDARQTDYDRRKAELMARRERHQP